MESFVASLTAATSPLTTTENGAIARSTTGSAVLDLFSQIGGLRQNLARCHKLVLDAWSEDPDLTARCVFYGRDVRGGQGEREVFRTNLLTLIKMDSRFKSLIKHIPEYGRWDDLFTFIDVARDEVMNLIKTQFSKDLRAEHPSLMGKWLPSENASSKKTIALAKMIRKELGLDSRQYRKALSRMRKAIDVVERKMSSGEWNVINFPAVPSKAMLQYRKAFMRQAPEGFKEFLSKVESGEVKINASTLFPYELVNQYCASSVYGFICDVDPVVEAQWAAQPDYFNGSTDNSLVMCDVSGSMNGLPLQVSISLGIYAAERNRGVWHNKFMTFSSEPSIQSIRGETLRDKVFNLARADWDQTTNIEAAFDIILDTALSVKLDPSEMVTRVYIISDMEFDDASMYDGKTLFQFINAKYAAAGYQMPELVFWNVNARNSQVPMAMDERGFLNVSGCSASVFSYLVGKSSINAYELMLEVLNSPRYSSLSVM